MPNYPSDDPVIGVSSVANGTVTPTPTTIIMCINMSHFWIDIMMMIIIIFDYTKKAYTHTQWRHIAKETQSSTPLIVVAVPFILRFEAANLFDYGPLPISRMDGWMVECIVDRVREPVVMRQQ